MNFLVALSTNWDEFSNKIKLKEIQFYMFKKVLNVYEIGFYYQTRKYDCTIWPFV